MKSYVRILCVVGLLVSPVMADFSANLGPTHSTLGGYRGGSFGVALQGTVPSYLQFGPSAGEEWGSLKDTAGRTFCVENVIFNTHTWYAATVDATVIYGGPGQKTTLTDGTRIAFSHYVEGTLPFTVGLDADGNQAMQAYFWDQQHVASNGSTWFNGLSSTQKNYYTQLGTLTATGRESSVAVLNLWAGTPYLESTDKQSHLVMVPAPAASMLVLIGLGLVGWIKRRIA